MTTQSLYRAVHLRADLEHPDRLGHYQPTSRSVAVINAVLGNDASIVIAAYGSGKSLAAGIGALIVRNDARAQHALKAVLPKLRSVDNSLYSRARTRVGSRAKGVVVTLAGYVPDLVGEIASSLGAPKRMDVDRVLKWVAEHVRADHLAIIWDEFGRHLEGLVVEGRARDVDQVQRLAEWVVRARSPTSSLTLLLHQNLLAYAGSLNQTSRNEWRKVEGRFRQIRFVEDSRELYSLVASAVAERRPRNSALPPSSRVKAIARAASKAGWFDGPRPASELIELLELAHPVSAGALHVLPQVVARIGQNERSIFSFLQNADMSNSVAVEEVYRFFSEAMRTDIGPAGTHRRWLETESARSRAENDTEREILAATCLFQLGASGERQKLPKEALVTAVASAGTSVAQVRAAVEALLGRKLLIHRQANDDISLWHGMDIDIAGRLAEECARRDGDFDLLAFLNARHPAPVLRAPRHNAAFGAARYLAGVFVVPSGLQDALLEQGGTSWGAVLFVLADTQDGIAEAERIAREQQSGQRSITVIPRTPLAVRDAALELATLEALRRDDSFISQDPLVAQELDGLLSLARRHLATVLHRLTSKRGTDAVWLYGGKPLNVTGDRPASVAASDLLDSWYPETLRISNDQLMRQRISRQMSTARVRIIMRIMEHKAQPRLGYGEQDGSAEASVYRTVLERPGLHRLANGRWGFAEPHEINDRGLRRAWSEIAIFFQTPGVGPRPLSHLVSTIASPPIGVPSGIIPILVMAGYRAFAKVVSLRTDGEYVRDILGFGASRMFVEPERHTVEVHDGSAATVGYLADLAYVFTHQRPAEDDEVLRFTHDAFAQWLAALAEGARRSVQLSERTQRFLYEAIQQRDPARLFLGILPHMFGPGEGRFEGAVEAVEGVRNEVDSILKGYLEDAVRILDSAFRIGANGDAVSSLQNWVSCFDVDSLVRREDLRMTDRAILRTARDTINGHYTPQSLARAVSSILLQRGIEQWQDSTAAHYTMLVRECRARIEDAALASDRYDERIVPIVKNRIAELQTMLARLGERELRHIAGVGGGR
jgi:hypothetical protein